MNISDFIAKYGVTADVEPANANPNMSDAAADMSHWLVTLRVDDRSMAVPFSMGSAHTEPPTASDVLECLASDAAGYVNANGFDDWADDYGYDTDSRAALATYETIGDQLGALGVLLGGAVRLEILMFEVDQ